MHRTIAITLPPEHTEDLVRKLEQERFVLALTVDRGTAIKTRGDLITVSCLNRGTDQVLQAMQEVQDRGGEITVVTARADSISSTGKQKLIDSDVDEGIWEEMESGLVHHGRLTPNYVALMALGGAIAGAALFADETNKVISFVAASIIAPGYEPVVKIPLSALLRRWEITRHALLSLAVGYAILVLTAALVLLGLQAIGGVDLAKLGSVPEVHHDTAPGFDAVVVSLCAAAAGAVMIASFRETVLAGPLIGLALVPVAAMLGGAVASWNVDIMWAAAKRLFMDMAFVVVLGWIVFWLKQRLRHRRLPIT